MPRRYHPVCSHGPTIPAVSFLLGSHPLHTILTRSLLVLATVWCTGTAHAQAPPLDAAELAAAQALPTDPATVIARVGQQSILLGDLSPKVEARIADVLAKSGEKIPEDYLAVARQNLIRGALTQAIQNKMMRELFLLDQVATQSADKRREAEAMMQTKAREMFFESELPELKKQYKVDDLTELDGLLREKGSSLQARQREFVDAMLGHLYIRSKVDKDPHVTLAEINEYYETHKDDYLHKARARWEQLTVLYARFPSREAAGQAMAEMGNEVAFGGRKLSDVAREKSHEPFATNGGLHEWTEQDSLASEILDRKVFSLPLNLLSEIIEDTDGFHIIRVLEREEAGLTSLSNVQDEIRAQLRQDKINESQTTLMESMRDRVPVWTLFPQDMPGAKPLPTLTSKPYAGLSPANAVPSNTPSPNTSTALR